LIGPSQTSSKTLETSQFRSIHSKCKKSKKYKKIVVLKVEIIIENMKNLWFGIPIEL
jgi:hypothetical protein